MPAPELIGAIRLQSAHFTHTVYHKVTRISGGDSGASFFPYALVPTVHQYDNGTSSTTQGARNLLILHHYTTLYTKSWVKHKQ
jgi:hypothetical protein